MPFGVLPKNWQTVAFPRDASRALYDEAAEKIVYIDPKDKRLAYRHPEWGNSELYDAVKRREEAMKKESPASRKSVETSQKWVRDVIDSNTKAVKDYQEHLRKTGQLVTFVPYDQRTDPKAVEQDQTHLRRQPLKWCTVRAADGTKCRYVEGHESKGMPHWFGQNNTSNTPGRKVTPQEKKRLLQEAARTPNYASARVSQPRVVSTKRTVSTKPKRRTKLLTTKRCARGSRGSRKLGARRVVVCCPPGMFRPRMKRRKCKVTRRRLLR